jgi:hypothetical protein
VCRFPPLDSFASRSRTFTTLGPLHSLTADDLDEVVRDHPKSDPSLHTFKASIAAAIQPTMPLQHADTSFASGVVRQNYELMSRKGKPVFYAFDLLWLNGDDLRSLPLIERKRRLHKMVRGSRCHEIIYAQHVEDQGIRLFEEICARDLEGIVAKRKLATYKSNGLGWKKIKNPNYSQAEGRHDLFKRMRER